MVVVMLLLWLLTQFNLLVFSPHRSGGLVFNDPSSKARPSSSQQVRRGRYSRPRQLRRPATVHVHKRAARRVPSSDQQRSGSQARGRHDMEAAATPIVTSRSRTRTSARSQGSKATEARPPWQVVPCVCMIVCRYCSSLRVTCLCVNAHQSISGRSSPSPSTHTSPATSPQERFRRPYRRPHPKSTGSSTTATTTRSPRSRVSKPDSYESRLASLYGVVVV